ncbi:MAG: hypothetical protein LBR53_03850 [Deltaproteobacteria bacterium]|jgi:hypothetical protein|nr:hypothetical protein [Deltaproteobacteria bacterium]
MTGKNDKYLMLENLEKTLIHKDGEALSQIISSYFAGSPSILHSKKSKTTLILKSKPNCNEHFFHQLLLSLFWALSRNTRAKEPGSSGTPDLIAPLDINTTVIIEIKRENNVNRKYLNKTMNNPAKKALSAIEKKSTVVAISYRERKL